jgi:thioester reductase-like protein
VCGDVSKVRLGLTELEWNRLSQEIDEVIHCAAEVNNIKSYRELYPVNVQGTAEVLKFCNTGKPKFLHYCSTLSVFVSTDRNSGLLKESDRLENVERVYGGYARSKFTAEKLLLEAQNRYPWINIVRFGLITGENRRSRDESLMMLIREIARSGIRPADLADSCSFDLTPVEKAALAFCRLTASENCGVFHVANEQSVSLKRLIELLAEKVNLKPVSFESWQNALQENRSAEGTAVYLSLCRLWKKETYEKFRTMDILQGTGVEFECRTIKKLGCPINKADDHSLNSLIDFALEEI